MQIKENTRLGPDTLLSPILQGKISPLCTNIVDPLFYREVAMADLPAQYVEEVETFRRILNLPDPRETMPRSSTSVLRS